MHHLHRWTWPSWQTGESPQTVLCSVWLDHEYREKAEVGELYTISENEGTWVLGQEASSHIKSFEWWAQTNQLSLPDHLGSREKAVGVWKNQARMLTDSCFSK